MELYNKKIAIFSDFTFLGYDGELKIRPVIFKKSNESYIQALKKTKEILDNDSIYQRLLSLSKTESNESDTHIVSKWLFKFKAKEIIEKIQEILFFEIFVEVLQKNGYTVLAGEEYIRQSEIDKTENIIIS